MQLKSWYAIKQTNKTKPKPNGEIIDSCSVSCASILPKEYVFSFSNV